MAESTEEAEVAKFPSKLKFLFEPKMPDGRTPVRYRVGYGGRGGAKTWNYARALLMKGKSETKRVLCGREYQNSIKESVHKVLADQITALRMNYIYEVQQQSIKARPEALDVDGKPLHSEFIFKGFHQDITAIKSTEGIDVLWVEEAQGVTKTHWDVLDPTIRKDGSEIWISLNPDLETDETYQRFVLDPPNNALVVKLTWRDNPWFPETLRVQMEQMKAKDYASYLHVWEGECKIMLEGAVYGEEMQMARVTGRVCKIHHDPAFPVDVIFDLGKRDYTAAWFRQLIAFEARMIDYFQDRQLDVEDYIDKIQQKKYHVGTIWLPHDAKAKRLGTKLTIQEQFQAAFGKRSVRIVPNLRIADGINAARMSFRRTYFDREHCADGLQCLTHYRYEVSAKDGVFSKEPVHDKYSHGADAFRYEAVTRKLGFAEAPQQSEAARKRELLDDARARGIWEHGGRPTRGSQQGWMRN